MAITVGASDFRARTGELLDAALEEPVILPRHGRRIAVVVSPDFYDRTKEALGEFPEEG